MKRSVPTDYIVKHTHNLRPLAYSAGTRSFEDNELERNLAHTLSNESRKDNDQRRAG